MILSGGQGWSIIPRQNNVGDFPRMRLESHASGETGPACQERFTPISSIIGISSGVGHRRRVYWFTQWYRQTLC